MAGRIIGDGDTFFLMVLYTRLEHGGAGSGLCDYNGDGLYIHGYFHGGYLHC